ncbi:MAG TPA: tRNA (adenosine(37)-N6)-threonylcarbamoyltransferase complex dimerization subunit type 1 TsaB, partial [Kiloniellales bacterium]|nr:tRNA (adenosine(37)-N6)-threonylcarbamoyltransferase complex dimerization subunit type 1 TsaB [Kiloniellales bacterium]
MRRLLAIDAAGDSCSAAVWSAGQVAASRREQLGRGQSERLLPLVEAVMAEAGQDFDRLDAIAVTLGPGGFTGVRIGLAAAEGLALAWDLPILGLSSFAVAAAALDPAERDQANLLLLLDAKRVEVYAEALDPGGRSLLSPCLIAPQRLAERLAAELAQGRWLLAGNAVDQAWAALAGRGALQAARPPTEAEAAVLARLAAT